MTTAGRLSAASALRGLATASTRAAAPGARRGLHGPHSPWEPDWVLAYQARQQAAPFDTPFETPFERPPGTPFAAPLPAPLPLPVPTLVHAPSPEPPPAAGLVPAAASPTLQRLQGQHRAQAPCAVAEPRANPAAPVRHWTVSLPGAGEAWALHVQQAQPGAPLGLALQVPGAVPAPSRAQLDALERRLRAAGHAVLGTRLRQGGLGQPLQRDAAVEAPEDAPEEAP